MATRNTKKLVGTVLALGAATGAIVFGSFASWTATTSNNNNKIETGKLEFDNSKASSAYVFQVANVKPSSTYATAGTVTITNKADGNDLSGATMNFAASGTNDTALAGALNVKISYKVGGTGPAISVYDGLWSGLGASQAVTGAWPKGQAREFTFEYQLPTTTDNTTQGKAVGTDITWIGTL